MTPKQIAAMIPARRRTPSDSATAPASGKITEHKTVCSTCTLRGLCVPCCGLTRSERAGAERLVFNRSRVRRGDSLYRTNDRFVYLYAVRTGFFKSIGLLDAGREQVTGFSMTGDVMGMDGIASEKYTCNTVALEDSDVCAIQFAGLQKLAQEIPSLQRQIHKTMSRAIIHKHGLMLLLGSMNAEQRVAMFLVEMSQRFAARGWSPTEFDLRMTREEIGSYLGLTLETVSRSFSKFQQEGLVSVRQKRIRILDSAGLERAIGRELS